MDSFYQTIGNMVNTLVHISKNTDLDFEQPYKADKLIVYKIEGI